MMKKNITQSEYFEKLNKIESILEADPERALEELKTIFTIKPVRKKWYLLKAKALWVKNHKSVEVFTALRGKYQIKVPKKIDEELLQMQISVLHEKNYLDREKQKFAIETFSMFKNNMDFYRSFQDRITKAKTKFLDNFRVAEHVEELARCYYISNDMVFFVLLDLLRTALNLSWKIGKRDWPFQLFNMGYLIEQVRKVQSATFIVLETDENDILDCEILVKILSYFKKEVYLIKKPVVCSVQHDISLESTLPVTLDNLSNQENCTLFHSIEIEKNGEVLGDNREYIINYIIKSLASEHFVTLLCSGTLFCKLERGLLLRKQVQRLSPIESEFFEKKFTFGWAGDYLKYCDALYGFDTKSMLVSKDKCEFSIVIPARNSAYYLRHALKTCLNQRYTGKYEIVLSDNSSEGNIEVYNLFVELNDPRIKYFRTPRELPLTKSFEYAFLQARGKFVFAIGSDDGVLPWALDSLEKVLRENPGFDVLTWERGFYAWPGFNGKQQHQFNIVRAYQKDKYSLSCRNSKQTLMEIIDQPHFSYVMPLLYLNSGCKRQYFKKILEKTGRLWDGVCQDLYMGVANLAINETYTFIQYPLTVAGMSNGSMGVSSVMPHKENADVLNNLEKRKKVNNIGGYGQSKLEYIVPPVDYDSASLYRSIVRMASMGCLSKEFLTTLDWKKIYFNIAMSLSREDVTLEQKLDEFRYSARLISPEFADFVEKEICQPFLEPVVFEKKVDDQKRGYTVGLLEGGGAILDASEFGVENIYDATLLFEKLTGL